MNGHSAEYEAIVGFDIPRDAQPEWYALTADGMDILVDTSDACEQYALTNYSLNNDQFDTLCDGQPVRTSDGYHLQIVSIDVREREVQHG